ncbi:MAG: ComEA family DNA-binding protein [Anaerolineales bacterium]
MNLLSHPAIRNLLKVLIGVAIGLGAAGLVLLIGRQPQGVPIALRPAPTELLWMIHIEGAVVHPGVYSLPPGSRLKDALQAAGGALAEADLRSLNLARLLVDGERIDVPYKAGFEPLVEATPTPRPQSTQQSTPSTRININYATREELMTLPGIGPVLAQRIIEYRETYGPFVDVEELLNVEGIGQALLDQIRDLITVEE